MTLFNYWHYIVLSIIFLLFIAGVVASFKQENMKMKLGMMFSVILVSIFLVVLSIIVIDKYTKVVKLHKMRNQRFLTSEQIVYSGLVKNEGKYDIGKVTFEIKLVNKGHLPGNIKGGSFYKASGFLGFFTNGFNIKTKPQSITKDFIVARNLKAGEVRSFKVRFGYPPYFRGTSQFPKVWGH